MPNQATLNPLLISKFVLWIVAIVAATILLRRHKVTSKVRLAFLVGGVLVFAAIHGGGGLIGGALGVVIIRGLEIRQVIPRAG